MLYFEKCSRIYNFGLIVTISKFIRTYEKYLVLNNNFQLDKTNLKNKVKFMKKQIYKSKRDKKREIKGNGFLFCHNKHRLLKQKAPISTYECSEHVLNMNHFEKDEFFFIILQYRI